MGIKIVETNLKNGKFRVNEINEDKDFVFRLMRRMQKGGWMHNALYEFDNPEIAKEYEKWLSEQPEERDE